ncbi:MAG: LamG-like jellyroll fold domain-containing protein [Barnesiella sp.]|jgi:hypothetical protein|nr:T9SS type A sorting domain-containing protein [Bacteroidales bacterium]
MKITKLFSFLFALSLLSPQVLIANDIEWSFDSDAQGWHDMGDDRDVVAGWENGKLTMTYTKRSSGMGSQLWFPAVKVDDLDFSAADYPYLEIYYEANWPTVMPVKFLITLVKTDNTLVHSFADIDPSKHFVSIDISANVRTDWGGTPYAGQIKSVELELPHNSDPASNPATNWFNGRYTYIDKVVLTDTQNTDPEEGEQVRIWNFDKDFADTQNELVAEATGNPQISAVAAKSGDAGLLLDGESLITMPESKLFTSAEMTAACWIKTTGEGQKDSTVPAEIFSYNNGDFTIAIKGGNLVYKNNRLWEHIASLKSNTWQHIAFVAGRNMITCYVNGKKVGEILAVPANARTGNFVIGRNGLMASMDELSIYNYILTEKEIAELGTIPLNTVSAWTFKEDLEGWHEIEDGSVRDVSLSYEPGAMVMTYVDKAHSTTQLWFPQVEVLTNFDAELYPYCDISYEAVNWPVNTMSKALFELKRADGTIAYAYFDLDPAQRSVSVDLAKSDPGWGAKYSGEIVSVRLEIPHNGSANPASDWYGASTRITKIEFNAKTPPVSESWNTILENSSFVKSGLDKLNRTDYQYQPIGLGGTALRVDPWGFAGTKAPQASAGITWHIHKPYYGYEYWWDKEGHRFNPFIIKGGYGNELNPGTITDFSQKLDIRTGLLNIDLGLNVDGTQFTTKRTVFVTPDGVLVIHIEDAGAPSPVKLNLMVDEVVRIYGNSGIYDTEHDPWTGSAVPRSEDGTYGTVVTATRPNTSVASLAVAVETSSSVVYDKDNTVVSATDANGAVTFYIAPASTFNPATPEVPHDHAWNKAYAARLKGYEAVKQETSDWWRDYLGKSQISIPDEKVAKLYAQSLFYHGVYFGNTSIPPGCNSTDIESFAGAICPEYDLVLSQMALLYTGHLNEAKNIADWTYSVLPKAKSNAVDGISHYDVTRRYPSGAIYTTLMGYDGTMCKQPTPGEGINLKQNYPGANASLIALSYLDYSNDNAFKDKAYDILKSTTYVSLADLIQDGNYYRCGAMPNVVQESAARMGYNECVKRGIADPEWSKYENKILIPTTTLFGDTLIAGGVGAVAVEGQGDATWLSPLWWYGVVDKSDSKILPSYINSAKSSTGDYIFNNGTMGVIASKLGLGNDALSWLRNFESSDVLYDETCFTESRGQLFLTPEIGAHGGYICNVSQMLMDPDNDESIDIFPAVPTDWEYKKVGFNNLMAKGGLALSAERDLHGMRIEIENNSDNTLTRELRVKIPASLKVSGSDDSQMKDGALLIPVTLASKEKRTFEYTFTSGGTDWIEPQPQKESDGFRIYPNPNPTGTLYISDSENIDEICIYSLSGNVVARFKGGYNSYNIGMLDAGVYLLTLKTTAKEYVSRKLIVMN